MGSAPVADPFSNRDDRRETREQVEASRRAIRESLRLLRAGPDAFVGAIAPEKQHLHTRTPPVVTPFRLYIIRRPDAVERVDVFCDDHATALRAALSIPDSGRIEVWRGGELIRSWRTDEGAQPPN